MLESYKPEVAEDLTAKYAKTVISEKDIKNLEWARDYLNWYERTRRKILSDIF